MIFMIGFMVFVLKLYGVGPLAWWRCQDLNRDCIWGSMQACVYFHIGYVLGKSWVHIQS